MFGRERSQLVSTPVGSLLEEGQSRRFFGFLHQAFCRDNSHTLETRVRCAGGVTRDVRLICTVRANEMDQGLLCYTALIDITEEKRQQETLRLHSLIMKEMHDGVILVRAADSTILETNPAGDRVFGYNPGELVGRHIAELNAGNDHSPVEIAEHIAAELEKSGKWRGEMRNVKKDGSRIFTEATVTAFDHEQHGKVWLGVYRDVTERKQAEVDARKQHAMLAHVARVNIAGELASALAHELTQPLMAIEYLNHALAQKIQKHDYTETGLSQSLQSVTAQAQRASEIIRSLRDFVRRGAAERTAVSVGRVVEDSLALLGPLLSDHSIEVKFEYGALLPSVYADRVQVEQVLINLLRNAIEAMVDANSMPRCVTLSCAVDADKLQVSVRDSGPGLDPALAKRLFNIFETTKGQGMGMGLAISRSIITAHGGRLWYEPGEGGGVVFHFTLPIAADTRERQ